MDNVSTSDSEQHSQKPQQSARSEPREPHGPVPSRRGRRPAAQVRSQALRVAAELLFDGGVRAVTFERVAAAGGASKTTLYKWWSSPGALAAEAYFDRVGDALDFPDTGDIQADLRTQLCTFVDLITVQSAGRVVRQLIGASQSDPVLREAFAIGYSRPRRDEAMRVLERARDRGQLREDAPLDVMVDQLWGACYHRLLILDEPLDADLINRLVQNALYGAVPVTR